MRALRHVSVSEFHELAWTQWAYNVLGCGPAGNSPAGYRTACSMTFVVILFLFTCVHFTYSAIMYLYFIERTHNADRGKYSQMCVDIRIRHKHWHTQTHKEWKILNLESFDKSLRCCWRLCMPQCIHSCSLSLSRRLPLSQTHIYTQIATHTLSCLWQKWIEAVTESERQAAEQEVSRWGRKQSEGWTVCVSLCCVHGGQ